MGYINPGNQGLKSNSGPGRPLSATPSGHAHNGGRTQKGEAQLSKGDQSKEAVLCW